MPPPRQTAQMPRKKLQKGFRLSNYFRQELPELADEFGLSQAGVLELLIRRCGRETTGLKNPVVLSRLQRERESSSPMEVLPFRLTKDALEILQDLSRDTGLSTAEVLEACLLNHRLSGREGIG